jgi:plastocyanin
MLMRRIACVLLGMACCLSAKAEDAVITGHVDLVDSTGKAWRGDQANTAVWLIPMAGSPVPGIGAGEQKPVPRLVQKNKTFEPRVVILRAGTAVEFPNHDPFFHNVFSLFDGKRFDLGLYEGGGTRSVHFDKPGISYIFCNIHPEMNAVVIAVATPYYGLSDSAGNVAIRGVPPGHYVLHIWKDRVLPGTAEAATRQLTIAEGTVSFGTVRLPMSSAPDAPHKNKYGREYDPGTPANPVYEPR